MNSCLLFSFHTDTVRKKVGFRCLSLFFSYYLSVGCRGSVVKYNVLCGQNTMDLHPHIHLKCTNVQLYRVALPPPAFFSPAFLPLGQGKETVDGSWHHTAHDGAGQISQGPDSWEARSTAAMDRIHSRCSLFGVQ